MDIEARLDAIWLSAQILAAEGVSFDDIPVHQLGNEPVPEQRSIDLPFDIAVNQLLTKKIEQFTPEEPGSAPHPFVAVDASNESTGVPVTLSRYRLIEIERSLRPLKKKVPSSILVPRIEEQGTIEKFAEEIRACKENRNKICSGLFSPLVRAALERWLDIVLVVDCWPTMQFWQDQVSALYLALQQSGVFHRVSVVKLRTKQETPTSQANACLVTEANLADSNSIHHEIPPCYLVDPTGRRLILILSDCLSPIWDDWGLNNQNKGIGKLLQIWCKHHLVALVQMLPQHLWQRSGLTSECYTNIWSTIPISPNSKLEYEHRSGEKGIPLPVFNMDSKMIGRWANLAVNKPDGVMRGIVLHCSQAVKIEAYEQINSEQIQKNLKKFQSFASQESRDLAGYLAVGTVSLDKIQSIHDRMMPNVSNHVMADVLLSGLLAKQENVGSNHRSPVYRFVDDDVIRRKLLQSVSPRKILEAAAHHYDLGPKLIDRNTGQTIDFWDLVKNPQGFRPVLDDDVSRSVATDYKRALSFCGPQLQPLANALGQMISSSVGTIGVERLTIPPEKVYLVEQPDPTYLEFSPIHVSVWGAPKSGKTWLVQSLGKHLSIRSLKFGEKVQLHRVDHFGSSQPENIIHPPEHKSTVSMQDYLFMLRKTNLGQDSADRSTLICIHDFPGENTLDIADVVDISYRNSDALLMCIEDPRLAQSISVSTLRQAIAKFLTQIASINHNQRALSLAVCITKYEHPGYIDEPWQPLTSLLGHNMVDELRTPRSNAFKSRIFYTRAWQGQNWKPGNIASPFFWFLEEHSSKQSKRPQQSNRYLYDTFGETAPFPLEIGE